MFKKARGRHDARNAESKRKDLQDQALRDAEQKAREPGDHRAPSSTTSRAAAGAAAASPVVLELGNAFASQPAVAHLLHVTGAGMAAAPAAHALTQRHTPNPAQATEAADRQLKLQQTLRDERAKRTPNHQRSRDRD